MGLFTRHDWAYRAVTHDDWPYGIGTDSANLPRERRYAVIRGMGEVFDKAMKDLANTPLEDDPGRQVEIDTAPERPIGRE